MRVGIVLYDCCFGSALTSIVDVLTTAERFRAEVDESIPPIEFFLAANRRRVTATGGLIVPASRTLQELDDVDVVVVPAFGTMTGADTEAVLTSRSGRALVGALAGLELDRTRIAAACTGVFALAEAGVLDGRLVTTAWFLTPVFRARYPKVSLDLERMVVADGPIVTAGAAFAHADLALALVGSTSPALAQHVARLLLIDERPSQAAFVTYDRLQHDDPIVLAFERYIRQHLDRPFDATVAARAIGTSRRTLERRTRGALDLSPLDIVHQLRVERAAHLRRTTDLSNEAIARRVGYANAETLRALERRRRTPRPAGELGSSAAAGSPAGSATI